MDQDLLKAILHIAERMTESGAEISRVEECIIRICRAYQCRHVDVYATTANIIVTVETAERIPLTQHRRIGATGTDIDRLDRLNDLARYVVDHTPETAELRRRLDEIEARPRTPQPLIMLCYSIIPAAFCLLFGSRSPVECLFAGLIGFVLGLLIMLFERTKVNKIFARFLCSLVTAFLVKGLMLLHLITCPDYIIIGNIMTLIPGVGFTNALRDLFVGDMFTGTIRTVEAMLLAIAIAVGFAIPDLLVGGLL